MIEDIRSLPIEQVVSGITQVAQTTREADAELTLALTYAHRVMDPPMSLRRLSSACGLSPSTIRARVRSSDSITELNRRLSESPGVVSVPDGKEKTRVSS